MLLSIMKVGDYVATKNDILKDQYPPSKNNNLQSTLTRRLLSVFIDIVLTLIFG